MIAASYARKSTEQGKGRRDGEPRPFAVLKIDPTAEHVIRQLGRRSFTRAPDSAPTRARPRGSAPPSP
jgi:hypothetical protein